MNLNELKEKLSAYNVPDRWYSLDDGLKPDACILYKNYSAWEFFYMDERGSRHDYRSFDNENDACDFLWMKMAYQLHFFKLNSRMFGHDL